MKKISKALVFASNAHRGQLRKDGKTPYINHPIQVMNLLVEEGIDDSELLCAALLHDVVEDTDTSTELIEKKFGKRVAELVAEVTDDKFLSQVERKQKQLATASQLSYEARLIRLCDKICNVHDMLHAPPRYWETETRMNYVRWGMAVVDAIRGTHEGLERRFDLILRDVQLPVSDI
jgi:GTP diphosphokinase / guanosine-3',5'-bis(diphosphate) 3'-diphosphatase